jgi:MFS family permease
VNRAVVEGARSRQAGFPLWPLLATLLMQALATMAAYSIPAVAPAVARDLGISGAWVGVYISTVYSIGIVSALLSPAFIRRYGAVRVGQVVLLATLAMLLATPHGGVEAVALGAALLGLAYGATAPASTHLLVPRTPPQSLNLVLSLRQIGVPLGGMMAGLLMPPLTLSVGWRNALLLQAIPAIVLLVAMQLPRSRWDDDRVPSGPLFRSGTAQPLGLLREGPILRLSIASFVFSGLQLCFVAFMTVHLTTVAGVDLVRAGQALAAYQIAGAISRPLWGLIADKLIAAHRLLALQGVIMCIAAVLAGRFGTDWAWQAILAVCAVAGATASGYTGIAYGEYARLGGTRRTEATGLGAAAMFAGVMVIPTLFSLGVAMQGGYAAAYAAVGFAAFASGLLVLGRRAAGW